MKRLTAFSLLTLLIALLGASTASAATYYSIASGNWDDNNTWSLTSGGAAVGAGVFPIAGDDVIIENAFTVTVDVASACASVQLGGTATANGGTLTFSGSSTLTVSGAVLVGNNGDALRTGTITFTSGSTLTAGSLTLGGPAGTPAPGTIDMTSGGTLSVGGAITVNTVSGNTWTPGTGTVILTADNTLPATIFTTFNNLSITGGTTTLGVAIAVDGDLTIRAGATLDTTASNSYAVTLNGNFANSGGTFTANGSAITIGGTGTQTIDGFTTTGTVSMTKTLNTATFTGNVNGGALTINGSGGTLNLGAGLSHQINGAVTLTAGTLNGGSSTLSLTGDMSGAGTFTAGTGTVNYNGSGAQAVANLTYNNLTINKSGGTGTLSGAIIVNGNLTITAGTLDTSASNFGVTLNGSFSNSGTFTANASPITIGGTSTTPSIAGFSTAGALQFTRTASTATLAGNVTAASLTINGTGGTLNLGAGLSHQINGAVTLTAGTLNGGSSTLSLTGDMSAAGTFTAGTGTVNYNGSGAQAVANLTYNNLTINKSGGTGTLSGAIIVNGNLTITAGTLATANNGVTLNGNFFNSGTFTAGSSAITIGGTTATPSIAGFTTTGGVTMTKTAGTATLGGNVTAASLTINGSGGTLNLGTGLAHQINGNVTLTAGTLNGGSSTLSLTGNWANNGGTFTPGTSTVAFTGTGPQNINGTAASQTFNNLTVNNPGQTVTVGGSTTTLTLNTLTLTASTFVAGTAATINVAGNWANNGGAFTPGTGTVNLNGTGAQAINGTTLSQTFNNVTLNKTAGTLLDASGLATLTVNNLTETTGNFTAPTTLDINGALTLTAGTFTAGTTINIAGNWSRAAAATFNANSGTVIFDGTGAQSIGGAASTTFFNLSQSGSGTTTLAIATSVGGNLTVSLGTLNLATFAVTGSGGTFTVANGATLLVGGAANFPTTFGTYSLGATSIVNYDRSNTQTVSAKSYGNLTLSGTSAKTMPGSAMTISGNLTLSGTASATTAGNLSVGGNLNVGTGTTLTAGAFGFAVTGTTTVGGTLTHVALAGPKTYTGDVTINTGGIWNDNAGSTVGAFFGGSLQNNGAMNVTSSGDYMFTGTAKTFSGTSTITIPSVIISGTYQNNGTLTVTTALGGDGTLTNGGTGTLNLNFTGAVGLTVLTATAVGNTVSYGFAGTQTVDPVAYYNLTLTTSGVKTMTGVNTVAGNLTISGTATMTGNAAFTVSGTLNYNSTSGTTTLTASTPISIGKFSQNGTGGTLNDGGNTITVTGSGAGTWTRVNGTFVSTTGKALFTGAAPAIGAGNFFNLTLGGTAAATLGGAVTIAGDLTVPGGTSFTAGAFALTVTGSTVVTGTFSITSATGAKSLGNITINALGTFDNATTAVPVAVTGNISNSGTFNVGTGVYTVSGASKTISGTISIPSLTVSGTYTNTGILTVGTALSGTGTLTQGTSATLNIGGTSGITTLTATASPNLVNYNGTGAQSVKNTTYDDLTVSGGNTKTLGGSITVNSDLTIANGTTLDVSASLFSLSVGGNWANNGGTFFLRAGSTVTFTGAAAAQAINGSAASQTFNNLTVTKSGQTLSVGGSTATLTLNGNMAITAGTFDAGTATAINVAGNWTLTAGATFTPETGTVTFTGNTMAINGTATSQTFYNLTVNKTAGQTLSVGGSTATLTVNNLTETLGNFTPPATLNITGNFTHTAGTFTAGTGTVAFNGASPQILGGATATTFTNLTINNSAGVTLGASPTVNGTLTLTSGDITTGANQVNVANTLDNAISGGGAGSYVNGTLVKSFPNTANPHTFTFPIGDAANYTPVSLSALTVSTAGTVAAKVNAGDDPNPGSGIDTSRSVNHYWTLTPTTIVISGNYSATFGFTGIPTDVDAVADTSSFILRRFSGGAWTPTTAGTRTATSTAASGIAGFGEFAIGDPAVGAPSGIGTANSTTLGTTLPVTLTGGVPVGDTVIVCFAMDPVSGTVSATDTQGNSYTDDLDNMQGVSGSGTGVRTVVLSAHVTTALAIGNTITITHPSVTCRAASACYASGLLSASRVDQTATGGSSTVAATSGATGSATTLYADELLIGAIGIEHSNTTFTVGASYTALPPAGATNVGFPAASSIAILPEYRIVGATGAYTAAGSGWANSFWAADMVTYRTVDVSTPTSIGQNNATTPAGTTLAVTVPAAGVAKGNTVIVSFELPGTAGSVSVADTKGNTYTSDADVTYSTTMRTLVFSAPVTNALTSSDTITVTSPSVTNRAVSIYYVGGLVSASRVDQTSTGSGSSTAPSSGATAATTQPDELLWGAIGFANAGTFTVGAPFTALTKASASTFATIQPTYRIVSATGPQTASGTLGTSGAWAAAIVTYKVLGVVEPTHSTISPAIASITAGTGTQVITVQARDAYNNNITTGGEAVTLSVSAGTGSIGATTDNGNGTYTATLTAPALVGSGTVTATLNGLSVGTAVGASTSVVTYTPGALDHFAISAISSPQTAGTAITGITLTAQDVNNNTQTNFTGTVTYSGTAGITGTSAGFTSGVLSGVSVTPTVAGSSETFIVTGSGNTGTSTFDVNPGALDHFAISAISSPQTAGTAITGITLTALDANNNTLSTGPNEFTGTVTYGGTAGVTGTSAAFTAGQLTGVSVTPITAGSGETFTVTASGQSGTATFDVNPGVLDHFAISAISSPQTAGTAITGITLTAQDANNNTLSTGPNVFSGTVTYGGTAGVTGTSAAFTAGQLTGVSVTPITAGSGRTFTVTASGQSGTATFDVNPGTAFAIALTSGNSQSGTVGTPLGSPFVVTVTDADGNPKPGTSATFAVATVPSGATGQALSTTSATTDASGQASSTLTLGTKPGTYTVTATSAGLSGSPVTFTATGTAATINTLTASPNPSLPGANVTFTFTLTAVPSGAGTPTGTVEFKTNGVALLAPVTLDGGGVATLITNSLPHGSNTLVAEYAGNGGFLGSTGSVVQVVNTPPEAGTHFLGAISNTPLVITASTLVGLDIDADGDTLTITAVSSASTNGPPGNVTLISGTITYTPATGFVGADQFTYTISDGYFGGTATSTANVTVRPVKATSGFSSITSPSPGIVNLRGYGIPGNSYQVQRSTDGGASWTTLATVTAAANGIIVYTDDPAPDPQAFYRFAVL